MKAPPGKENQTPADSAHDDHDDGLLGKRFYST